MQTLLAQNQETAPIAVRESHVNTRFFVIAGIMAALYGVMAAFSYHDIIYISEWISTTSASLIEHGELASSPARDAVMLLAAAAFLYLYVEGFAAIKRNGISTRSLLAGAALLTAMAFATVPFDSTDVAVYINCGWVQSHYGLNPFGVAVGEIANWSSDPMFKEHWVKVPSAYGPAFALLARILTACGGANYLLTVFLFKACTAVCHALNTVLVLSLARRFQTEEQAKLSTYLYAFSPYMLLQGVANAHNDVIAATLALASLAVLFTRAWWLTFAALLTSFATKYGAITLIPSIVWMSKLRNGVKNTALAFAAAFVPIAALFTVYMAPIDDKHFVTMLNHLGAPVSSIRVLFGLLQSPGLDSIVTIAVTVGCLITAGLRVRHWNKSRDLTRPLADGVLFTILLICLFSARCQAWYPIMFFPLALLLPPDSKIRTFAVVLSGLLTFSIMWFGLPGTYMLPLFLMLATIATRVSPHHTGGAV